MKCRATRLDALVIEDADATGERTLAPVAASGAVPQSGAAREAKGRRKDGTLFPLEIAFAAWRDAQGRRFRTVATRDLTQRKLADDGLATARRMELIGQLAGGVAHDFNNLLTVIAGHLELAKSRSADDFVRSSIDIALHAVETGVGFNKRLLAFARQATFLADPYEP